MDEHSNEYIGTLYVLPESRQFEFKTTHRGAPVTLTGMVSQQAAAQFSGGPGSIDPRELATKPRRVEILTREIHERHRAPHKVRFLMRVLDTDGRDANQPQPSAAVV